MRTHDLAEFRYHLQPLESRRLLSFAPAGPDVLVQPAGLYEIDADVAVAADGSYLVAKLSRSVPKGDDPGVTLISVTRYSRAGEQIGQPLTVDSFSGNTQEASVQELSASIDADGDAVVAYVAGIWGPGGEGLTQRLYFTRVSKS